MDTKFKNQDILINILDRCMKFRYHPSAMIWMKNMIVNHNVTFEQAVYAYEHTYSQKFIYYTISKMYHRTITELNNVKFQYK